MMSINTTLEWIKRNFEKREMELDEPIRINYLNAKAQRRKVL